MRFAALPALALVLFPPGCGQESGSDKPGSHEPGSDNPSLNDARAQTTKVLVDTFANSAYPRWSLDNTAPCPADVAALEPLVNKKAVDAWGHPLVMVCGDAAPAAANGFGVSSVGPDGEAGTGDDIASWQPAAGT